MRRVIAVLMLLCASCVDRTENLDFSTNASVELEIPEMVTTDGGIGGIEGQKTAENGRMPKEKYNNGTSEATEATGKDENATYSSENGAKTASNHTDRESISEAVFYIFDENGLFMSKNIFAGGDDYKLNFTKNGRHSVYVLCNISEFADLPASPSQDELESLTIPHRESYDRLPFAGKTEVNVTPGEKPAIKIKLDRINSAIRIENHSADRMELTRITVNGLPNRGNIFGTDTEAADVTYSESAEAEIDAEGNAVVYSFFVPENKIANVKIEAEARVKDTEETGTTAATIAPLTFIDRLETGKQATALVGYMESGNIKIGSPDNWGNVGKYELPGGVRLQVIGGEFFDYKSAKALRAYSGGSEFSFVVEAADGVATLQTVGTAEWVEIRDNIIVVSANPAAAERECQVSVSVGGKNVGVFYIVQGKAITFSCSSLAITDNKLEKIGGTGSGSAVYTVTFDMSDDELAATEIAPEGNGENGITVEVNRSAKTVSVHFMALVDASQVGAEGVSVPVRFLDVNGTEQACLEVVQRPAKITFNPVRYKSISYQGGTVTASVTIEGDDKWNVNSVLDKDGKPVDAWLTGPATGEQFNSGGNLVLTVRPNSTSFGRMAYVTVRSRYTLSKPYEITQAPSYGVKNISSDGCWDNESETLKSYSKGRTYAFSFNTEIAVPDNVNLAVECGSESEITASDITHVSGNNYTFTLAVPDSDNTEEEVTSVIDITADDTPIGSFTVLRAYKPQFISMETSVWGGVKDMDDLKKAVYRASEWDVKNFTSSNASIAVTKISEQEIEVGYAETLTYDAEAQTTAITMNLNGGNSVSYTATQSPVAFTIDDGDLNKLKGVSNGKTDIDITVVTKAGEVNVPWHVASTSDTWLTTTPSAGGTETNASGSTLTVKFAANDAGDRTGIFVLESRNTTSPAYEVSQRGSFTATVSGVTYNGKTALFADGMLKAFSVGYDYTFNITTSNDITGSRLNIIGKTTGSTVTVKTQPSGADLKTNHSFVITVPATADGVTDEPESTFDIMADGNCIGSFTVKQAKKAGFAASTSTVNVTSVMGGVKSRPTLKNGSFVASEWDVSGVTSSNGSLPVSAVNVAAGTFKVGFAETLTSTSAAQSATITLDGADGTSRGSYSTTQKKVTFTFNPTSYTFPGQASLTQNIAVTTDAGTEWSVASNTNSAAISSTKSGSNLVLKTVANAPTTSDATADITLTLNDCTSQVFVAKQLRAMSATFTAPSGCVYASNTLSAYSAAKTYDFTLALNRAVDASKISIARTSGSLAEPTLTTTGSKTSHTVRVSVPASTLTTEPTSTFTITVDGDLVQTFTVKQAKKPSISVSSSTVWGGLGAVSGSFTASAWDVKSSAYVTSSNSNMGITLPSSNNGTFTVDMAESMDQTFVDRKATITLVGAYTAKLATCTIEQKKVLYRFYNTDSGPGEEITNLSYSSAGDSYLLFFTSSIGNPGTSAIEVESSETWCHVHALSPTEFTILAENNTGAERTAEVRIKLNHCWSQPITVTQAAAVTLKSFTAPSGCVYANNTLSAYSAAKTYDFTLALSRAVDVSKISITRTSGSLAVPTLTTTGSNASHTVRVSVPASTATTEPTSTFKITVDGNVLQTFTVKQAKKPSISVSTGATVWGGSSEVSGSFTASTWDVKSSAYVTSSNSNMGITLPSGNNGTFTVGMAASMDQTFVDRSTTITLVGANTASLATCTIAQKKLTYEFSNSSGPIESFSFSAAGGSDALFFTTNLGNPPSTYDIHVESSETWCHAIVKTTSGIQINIDDNTGTERTALIRLRINNCWSQPITVTQAAAVTLKSFTAPSGCVYANNTLSAYSAAKTYDFTLALSRAVDVSKISITRTSGSLAVPTLTTTGSNASHTVRVSVPASTATTEPTSTFKITVDGNVLQTFTVKQAKKPSISVSYPSTLGGTSSVSGSFTASTWDIKSTGYVTSSNSNMPILSPNKNGTFTVGMAVHIDHTFVDRKATITLVGANTAKLATCTIEQKKVVYTFTPEDSFSFSAEVNGSPLYFTTNAGNIPSTSYIEVESSETWCRPVVKTTSGIQIGIDENTGSTARTALIRLRILDCWSQPVTVTQEAGGPATVTIGGTDWTLYNLANPFVSNSGSELFGSFATKLPSQCTGTRAESHGRFYQWGTNVSWNSTGSSATESIPSNQTWQADDTPRVSTWTRHPCPDGFRLPSNTQFQSLKNACSVTYMSGTWSSTNYGYVTFTDGTNTSHKLEFPAVGYRDSDASGTLNSAGREGYYWSYVRNANDAYVMRFSSSSVTDNGSYNMKYGASVRCIRK